MMSLKTFSTATSPRVHRKARTLTFLFAILMAATLYSFAQDATIVGTVTDLTGAVVPNAVVTLTNVERGTSRSSVTNSDGQYVVPSLSIGRYNVRAESKGFKSGEEKGIVLNVGDRTRVDFKLEVGNVTETVSVEATAVGVQTDTGAVSTVITGEQVANLGVNGRSLYSLYALTPGASSLQGDKGGFTPVSGDSTVSINGQRAGHNLQILDGGENLDRGGSSASVMPSLDAVAEFNNQTSSYSAEYGLSSAATITTAVKSGTKTFHASAWEFVRNDALDARNYFNPAPAKVAELRFNVYGFNAGGEVPLFKSHPTFFFYNMEWRSLVQGGLTNQTVPLASEYGGVFPATGADAVIINVPSNVVGLGANCPGGVPPAGVVPGKPFPNNTIPACMLDPNAQTLLKAGIFPAQTTITSTNTKGTGQFIGGNNSPTKVREEIARVDHQFTDKFSVFGHWVSEQVSQTY